MAPARVAELIGKAAYYRVDECWIAKHPVLLLGEVLAELIGRGDFVEKAKLALRWKVCWPLIGKLACTESQNIAMSSILLTWVFFS